MDGVFWSLLFAAAGIALTHTALGPDHYLPFVMLARARGWSPQRTASVTALCGIGHVLSSVLLGGVGVAAGIALRRVEQLESTRGSLAAWALVAFGLAYATWGTRRALRRMRGIEPHTHNGHVHVHARGDLPHRHDPSPTGRSVTFWTLLTIFVLGPCEPLIPLFVLPASRGRWELAAWTAAVFGVVTVATMVGMTLLGLAGAQRLRRHFLEHWSHTLAGGIIAASGLAVLYLGL
jgi:sulfite exporter TauE/SafE